MANTVANAIDWYVNKMNKMHLIPVNLATMIRDLSAKQLSNGNFKPRPLTMDNFTDAELDAMHRLSFNEDKGTYEPITNESYARVNKNLEKGEIPYADENLKMLKYLSPIRSFSTTIGKAVVSPKDGDHVLHDVYDFNKEKIKLYKDQFGTVMKQDGQVIDDLPKHINERRWKGTSAYSRLRNAMARLGHTEEDPDSQKIHTTLSMNDVKKRLGDTLGTYDIKKIPSKSDFMMRSMGAGALTGAPIGAALGAISGAMLLINKNNRKKWVKHMLTHILGGAALASLAGAGITGHLANKAYGTFGSFEKKSAYRGRRKDKETRADKIKYAIMAALAYSLPLAALAGGGVYANDKYRTVVDKMMQPVDLNNETKVDFVDDITNADE